MIQMMQNMKSKGMIKVKSMNWNIVQMEHWFLINGKSYNVVI